MAKISIDTKGDNGVELSGTQVNGLWNAATAACGRLGPAAEHVEVVKIQHASASFRVTLIIQEGGRKDGFRAEEYFLVDSRSPHAFTTIEQTIVVRFMLAMEMQIHSLRECKMKIGQIQLGIIEREKAAGNDLRCNRCGQMSIEHPQHKSHRVCSCHPKCGDCGEIRISRGLVFVCLTCRTEVNA